MTDLNAIKARLEEWEKVDWMRMREDDPTGGFTQAIEDLRAVVDMLEAGLSNLSDKHVRCLKAVAKRGAWNWDGTITDFVSTVDELSKRGLLYQDEWDYTCLTDAGRAVLRGVD